MTGPFPASIRAVAQVFVSDLSSCEPSAEDARHLAKVLRVRPGETVVASDAAGRWRRCAFTGSAPWLVAADEVVSVPRAPEPVAVGFVPTKGDRPEWVVQKLTEMGVDRIVVLRSARSVVLWDDDRAQRSMERLGKVCRAAAAQSRRAWLPDLEGVFDLSSLASTEPLLLAHRGGGSLGAGALLCIGPEGGWTEEEVGPASGVVGLGQTVLRAETAAVVAGALSCALRDGRMAPGPDIAPVHRSGSLHPPR